MTFLEIGEILQHSVGEDPRWQAHLPFRVEVDNPGLQIEKNLGTETCGITECGLSPVKDRLEISEAPTDNGGVIHRYTGEGDAVVDAEAREPGLY